MFYSRWDPGVYGNRQEAGARFMVVDIVTTNVPK